MRGNTQSGSAAAAASSSATAAQATDTPRLYQVILNNPGDTQRVVLRSEPFDGAAGCYELTQEQLFALWMQERRELERENEKSMHQQAPRRIALFAWKEPFSFMPERLDLLKKHATHVARAMNNIPKFADANGSNIYRFLPNSNEHTNDRTGEKSIGMDNTFLKYAMAIPDDVLDAALNGDEAIVKMMMEKNPGYALYKGKATITHLGIERTGTPLQMALYSHDEKMVELIKKYMSPAEFKRQWEAVFGPDYDAFLKNQEEEAKELCSELEDAFKNASPTDVNNARNHVPNTASRLQDKLKCFNDNLEWYTRENPVHNPYILQRLFEIYDTPTFGDWDKECLLSQGPIWQAEKQSSAVWLQHIAQGIYHLGKSNAPEVPRRSFLTKNSPALDIRNLVHSGDNFCVDIIGRRGPWLACLRATHASSRPRTRVQNLCRAKTARFQKLLRRECEFSRTTTMKVGAA